MEKKKRKSSFRRKRSRGTRREEEEERKNEGKGIRGGRGEGTGGKKRRRFKRKRNKGTRGERGRVIGDRRTREGGGDKTDKTRRRRRRSRRREKNRRRRGRFSGWPRNIASGFHSFRAGKLATRQDAKKVGSDHVIENGCDCLPSTSNGETLPRLPACYDD